MLKDHFSKITLSTSVGKRATFSKLNFRLRESTEKNIAIFNFAEFGTKNDCRNVNKIFCY